MVIVFSIFPSVRVKFPFTVINSSNSLAFKVPAPIISTLQPSSITNFEVSFVKVLPFVSNVIVLSIFPFEASVTFFNTLMVSPSSAALTASSNVSNQLLYNSLSCCSKLLFN